MTAVVVAALATGGAVLAGPPAGATDPDSISGRVTDSLGNGIGGITVFAGAPTDAAETTTAADGTYELTGLSTETYTLSFRDGVTNEWSPEYWDDQDTEAEATPLAFTAGSPRTGIDAVLSKTSIAGRVTDADGAGLGGVIVFAGAPTSSAETVTAADGTYVLRGLGAGTFTVSFRDDDSRQTNSPEYWADQDDSTTATPLVVHRGDAITGIDAQLSRTTLSGVVRDRSFQPIAGVRVFAASPEHGAEVITGPDGAYTLRGLRGGTYQLTFFAPIGGPFVDQWWDGKESLATATPLPIVRGQNATADAYLRRFDQPVAPPSIGGRVLDTLGQPLGGIAVHYQSTSQSGDVATAPDGTYRTPVLHPGSYQVRFQDPVGGRPTEWWNNQPTVGTATPVVVGTDAVTGIDPTLANGPLRIRGQVTDAVTGTPLTGMRVRWSGTASGTSLSIGGNWQTTLLPAGTYTVSVEDPNGGRPTVWWHDQPSAATATPITVSTGTTADIDLAMAPTVPRGIFGRVTDANGVGIEDVRVAATSSSQTTYAITAADGTYRVMPPGAGTYTIEFRDTFHQRYSPEWWNDRDSAATAVPITILSAQAVHGIDAVLEQTTISGRVTDLNGDPIAGILAYAISGTETQLAETDADGNYLLQALPAGSWAIAFSDSQDRFRYEWWDDKPDQATSTPVPIARGGAVTGIDATLLANDAVPPTITIAAPVDGGSYSLGQNVAVAYSCADDTGVVSCTAPLPPGGALPTTVAGPATFSVTAHDLGGNTATVTASYEVLAGSTEEDAGGGDTVTTDPGGVGASPEVPVQTSVVVPAGGGGTVSIESEPAGASPPGFALLGQQVEIHAPPSTVTDPYEVTFVVDATALAGHLPADVEAFRDGVRMLDCTHPSNAVPDPCVVSRLPGAGGDAVIRVRTSHFSILSLGLRIPRLATQLAVDPVILQLNPLLRLRLGQVSARLTGPGGAALAGKPVAFTSAGRAVCAATTAANGVATCALSVDALLATALAGGVTATFKGDDVYLPTTGRRGLIG